MIAAFRCVGNALWDRMHRGIASLASLRTRSWSSSPRPRVPAQAKTPTPGTRGYVAGPAVSPITASTILHALSQSKVRYAWLRLT